MKFGDDREPVSDRTYWERLSSDWNPLRALGYLGWPAMLIPVGVPHEAIFKRA